MSITIVIPGEPVAFARSGQSKAGFRFTPKKQRSHMGVIKHFADMAMKGRKLFDGPLHVTVRVYYQWPKSWSNRKKLNTPWKTSKPDMDNLVKLVCDSCNLIVWQDDAQIVSMHIFKAYDEKPRTEITVDQAFNQPLEAAQ